MILLPGAVLFCVAVVISAQGNWHHSNGEVEETDCSSKDNGYTECAFRQSASITAVIVICTKGTTQCNFYPGLAPINCTIGDGGLYGYRHNILWVYRGCAATFHVYLTPHTCNGKMLKMSCKSVDGGYRECPIKKPGNITDVWVYKKKKLVSCVGIPGNPPLSGEGPVGIYGFDYTKIWVSRGCSAKFDVCISE